TFCALKHARSSYKPAIFIVSGFLVDTSSEVLGGENWALAVGALRVKGKESNGSSSSMFGEGLEKVELQREQGGREAFPGIDHSNTARPSTR
ncbi:unnamed protein product, partial [Laminaria digitata]